MSTSIWTWDYVTADGQSVDELAALPDGSDPRTTTFSSQADAETWLGECWRSLLEQGVDAVTLRNDGEIAYGPMSLHPA